MGAVYLYESGSFGNRDHPYLWKTLAYYADIGIWQIEVFFKVCKSYLKLAKECRALSYYAMTAHVAVVFIRYMMLAVENRETEAPRTLGELFIYFVDELADITFLQAFSQIMSLFSKMMIEKFDLDEAEISSMIDTFISALTPSMQRQLKAA